MNIPISRFSALLLFSVALVAGRVIYTGQLTFIFLLWNMFLAIIPLYCSGKLHTASGKGWQQWLYAGVWLLFFPNAMYIVTDLFHLRQRADIPLWYDLLLLLSAASVGVISGFQSLYRVEQWLQRYLSVERRVFIIFALLVLCGYGIYLGRYERWNSWHLLTQPVALLRQMWHHIIHPFRYRHVWMLSLAFGVWMHLLYSMGRGSFIRLKMR